MLEFDDQFTMFDITPLENLFIDEYMLRAPGDFVKVYIYALRQCYHPPRDNDYERMARALCMEPDDVKNAFTYWERQGLVRRVSDNPPSYRFFNLKANLMNQQNQDDGLYRYRSFNDRVQSMFPAGRLLHESDTKYLYDWMEVYKLPESVVLILVEYLLKKRGPHVRFASCDKIAREWADKGINTPEAAREQVHRDRSRYRAIMAGVGTVLADDPMLNCRIEGGRDPVRVICDSHLRTPLTSRIVATAREIPTILATVSADKEAAAPYEAAGCRVWTLPERGGRPDLTELMRRLGAESIDSVLLEGGGTLNWTALESGIVNRVQAYIAPKLFGGAGAKSPVGGQGVEEPAGAVRLRDISVRRLGGDILLEGEVESLVHGNS